LKPNPAGILAGTIVGNDIISCGSTPMSTYYQVTIFAGSLADLPAALLHCRTCLEHSHGYPDVQ
jgi:hypothetical protein